MQIVKDENRLGAFSVNNLFVSDYMAGLSGEAVKLYLYLCFLYENRQDTTQSAIMKTLHFSADVLKNTVGELRSRGLISTEDKKIALTDLSALKMSTKFGQLPNPPVEIFSEVTPALAEAMKAVNNTYFGGKMSVRWHDLIRRWQDDFDPEVFLLLFAHCEKHSSGRLNTNYVEKVAESWHADGIRTAKDVSAKIEVTERLMRFCDFMRRKLNRQAAFMDSDVEVMRKGLFVYHYGEEELSVLLERTDILRPTIRYFDTIITEWHEKGLKNAAEIRAYQEARKKPTGNTSGGKGKEKTGRADDKTGPRGNFEQREYTDDFFDALVSKQDPADGETRSDGSEE